MIRVLLAEDQAMLRGALAALLALEADIEVVAEVGRGRDVVPAALEAEPDVALVDIEMPEGDGLTAAAELHRRLPACRILILTTFGRPGYLQRALASGVMGFLVKDAPAAQLAQSIRRVVNGERVIDATLAAEALSDGRNPLTERERMVLTEARGGGTIGDIARALSLSEGTVRNYLSESIQKLDARNRMDAARIADQKGWL
jgi:two-component system response regulator DesR